MKERYFHLINLKIDSIVLELNKCKIGDIQIPLLRAKYDVLISLMDDLCETDEEL